MPSGVFIANQENLPNGPIKYPPSPFFIHTVHMITQMHLQNFKAWRDSGELALAPLTLLLGTNAGGKSSFIQSLLLLKQTLAATGNYRQLQTEGPLFNAGTLQDLLHVAADGTLAPCLSIDIRLDQAPAFHGEYSAEYNADGSARTTTSPAFDTWLQQLTHLPALRQLQADDLAELTRDAALRETVSLWLNRMGIADELTIKPEEPDQLYVCRLGRLNKMHHTGTGLSMALPVLITACRAQPESTVLIEEPEAHLHPLAQSTLAELFASISRTHQVQFMIETHSEHLFRRMQTLVARTTLNKNDAALFFVEQTNTDSPSARRLTLDDVGRVQNWPSGFFGDALAETREQARLMLTRSREL